MASITRIALLLALPFTVWSYDFFPWFGQDLQLEVTPSYAFRFFPNVNTDDPHFRAHESGSVLGLETSMTALIEWTLGVGASLAQTSHMEFGLNSVNFLVGHQWSNDRLGDPLTVSSVFVVNANGSRATRDLILYHSARWEFEAHTAFGKECACGPTWWFRTWMDLGLGFGTTGAPYFKGLLFFERNHCDIHTVGLFLKSWVGFGTRALKAPFYGYGSIRHRNLDVGFRYTYSTCYWGSLGIDLSLGCIASNYPRLPVEALVFWRFNVGP